MVLYITTYQSQLQTTSISPQDQSADYSINNSVGMKNVMRCNIVAGVYETLLEYAFITGEKRLAAPPTIYLQLIGGFVAWNHLNMC